MSKNGWAARPAAKRPTEVCILLPGRTGDVPDRCEDGGEEVVKAVPRAG
jgi:hypothetical protein